MGTHMWECETERENECNVFNTRAYQTTCSLRRGKSSSDTM